MRDIQLSLTTQVATIDVIPTPKKGACFRLHGKIPTMNTLLDESTYSRLVAAKKRCEFQKQTASSIKKSKKSIKICGRADKTVRGNKER